MERADNGFLRHLVGEFNVGECAERHQPDAGAQRLQLGTINLSWVCEDAIPRG